MLSAKDKIFKWPISMQEITLKTSTALFLLITLLISTTLFAETTQDPDTKDTPDNTLRITTTTLSKLQITTQYSAPASVISLNNSPISAEIQGRALKIKAEVGDYIEKGALLVELDCRDYIHNKQQAAAALQLSKTQLAFADKQFTRNQRLLQRGVVPRETFDRSESERSTRRADIELQKTQVSRAELAISRCNIYAPFSGQVITKNVQQGQLVTPGTPLVQLLQTSKLEVEAALSGTELEKARRAPQLRFIANNITRTVQIRSVIQQFNQSSNTLRVRLPIRADNQVIAGLQGRLVWEDGSKKIPPEYLVRRNNILGIMLAEGHRAKFHPLPDAIEGQPAKVSLPETTQVIVVNRYSAKDGQTVKTH